MDSKLFVVFSWKPNCIDRDLKVLVGAMQAAKYFVDHATDRMFEETYVSSVAEIDAKKRDLERELDGMNQVLIEAHRAGY